MPNLQIIKTLSEERKVTLKKIAEIAGLTEQGLHGAINKGDIKFSYLGKIANYLQVDLSVFSDDPPVKKNQGGISVIGSNSGNIAGGNIVSVTLPDPGMQKIIKADGTTIIEPVSPVSHGKNDENMTSKREQELLNTIALQKQLIDSLQDQISMLKK